MGDLRSSKRIITDCAPKSYQCHSSTTSHIKESVLCLLSLDSLNFPRKLVFAERVNLE